MPPSPTSPLPYATPTCPSSTRRLSASSDSFHLLPSDERRRFEMNQARGGQVALHIEIHIRFNLASETGDGAPCCGLRPPCCWPRDGGKAKRSRPPWPDQPLSGALRHLLLSPSVSCRPRRITVHQLPAGCGTESCIVPPEHSGRRTRLPLVGVQTLRLEALRVRVFDESGCFWPISSFESNNPDPMPFLRK